MKLEVGKRYIDGNGDVTSPIRARAAHREYKFIAEVRGRSRTWLQNGRWNVEKTDIRDLVSEAPCDVSEAPPVADQGAVSGVRKFDTGSVRDSSAGKPRVADLEPYTRLRFGYHMLIGADKYGAKNYMLGQPDDSNFESIHRHLALLEMGDTAEDHASAVIFSLQNVILNQQRAKIEANHFYEQHKNKSNETDKRS